MYSDSGSDFAPLNTTLSEAGMYVSSSIEADGDVIDEPAYNGPDWADVSKTLTAGDVTVQTANLILGSFDPIEAAIGAVVDILAAAAENCDSQASIFAIAAAAQSTGASTSQGYVASEQTSNGILTTQAALGWQQNMENIGGAVWQTSISDQYLQQMANASGDDGLSLAGTPTDVGTLTTSSSWTFMINAGGSSSIPDGCDDKLC